MTVKSNGDRHAAGQGDRYPTGKVTYAAGTYSKLKRVTCQITMKDAQGNWALGEQWYIQEEWQADRQWRDWSSDKPLPPPRYHLLPTKPTGAGIYVAKAWLISVSLRQAKDFVALLVDHLEKIQADGTLVWKSTGQARNAIRAWGEKQSIDVAGLIGDPAEE